MRATSNPDILIVDAHAETAAALNAALEQKGFCVAVETRAKEARATLERTPFDALVIDSEIAGAHNLNLVSFLRRRFPQARAIFIGAFGRFLVAQAAIGRCPNPAGPTTLREIREAARLVSGKRRYASNELRDDRAF